MTMTETSVRKSVTVQAPADRAFRVFTEGFGRWWPREGHHVGAAGLKEVVLECRDGGRWYEIGADGTEHDWGHVLTWDPPHRLVLAWQIDGNRTWHYNPNLITEVEVRFVPDGQGRTRVELEHRNLDRFGDAQDQVRAVFESPAGWQDPLDAFAEAAAA